MQRIVKSHVNKINIELEFYLHSIFERKSRIFVENKYTRGNKTSVGNGLKKCFHVEKHGNKIVENIIASKGTSANHFGGNVNPILH